MILILAELVRATKCRRLNWPVLLALLFPLIVVPTYIPLIRTHAVSYFPVAFQPNPYRMVAYYISIFIQPAFSLYSRYLRNDPHPDLCAKAYV